VPPWLTDRHTDKRDRQSAFNRLYSISCSQLNHKPVRKILSLSRAYDIKTSLYEHGIAKRTLMQVGGFKLPFIVVGSVIFLVGFASMLVLPPQNGKLLKVIFSET